MMKHYFILIGLFTASSGAVAQTLTSSDAATIQGKPVKSPLACSDGFVLTWIAANGRFECRAGGAGGAGSSPAGGNTQVQYNNAGAFGASPGFAFTSGTHE